jgi:hypothetical protein
MVIHLNHISSQNYYHHDAHQGRGNDRLLSPSFIILPLRVSTVYCASIYVLPNGSIPIGKGVKEFS